MDLDKLLKTALDRHLQVSMNETPENLAKAMEYSLLAPGKRIRPRLSLNCAEMIGLPVEAAVPAALSIEIIHCFTLIHDDLPCMDNDDFRRGRPSNHKMFGEATALLAGDGLMAMAFDVLMDAKPHVSAENLINAIKRLTWATGPRGVIGGQAAEMLLSNKSELKDLTNVHSKKTGALFSTCLFLPKDLAGIDDRSDEGSAIADFAAALGLAFQIADDLDDAEQDKGDPRNVIYFMNKTEAVKLGISGLEEGSKKLQKIWAAKADPLLRIGSEVILSLEKFR